MLAFSKENSDEIINIPVACIADRDIMPDCAPAICINEEYADKDNGQRRIEDGKLSQK